MNLIARTLFLAMVGAMLLVPMPALVANPLARSGLGGVEQSSAFPEFTFATLSDGRFQNAFESWFSKQLGLREAMIRTDNQINYSLFHTTRPGTVLGENNFLYEPSYIDAYNGLHSMPQSEMLAFVERLKELNDSVTARGTRLLVMITPSKAATYPEYLPERRRRDTPRNDTYERFQSLVREKGIPLFDTVPIIRALKIESEYPVFPPGGTHWSKYSACRVGEAFMGTLSSLLERTVPTLHCDPPTIRRRAVGVDRDLAKLTNLWTDADFEVPLPYPRIRVDRPPDAHGADLLFVGDSFLWPFFEALEQRRSYERRDFLYYYKSLDRFRARRRAIPRSPLDRAAIDWAELLKRDAIVLEFNEVNIHEMGYGFVEDALSYLRQPQSSGK